MKRSKKLFLLVAIVFFAAIAFLGYDISRRTTFPGSRPQLKERLIKNLSDSTKVDSAENKLQY